MVHGEQWERHREGAPHVIYFNFRNVIDLCLKFNVTRLVYTSSYNVIFSNKSLENIDESEPYPDDEDQYDYYSRSKKAAEILLLQYDGTQLGKLRNSTLDSKLKIFR